MKTYKFTVNGDKYEAKILEFKEKRIRVRVNNIEYSVELEEDDQENKPRLIRAEKSSPDLSVSRVEKKSSGNKPGDVNAPLPGLVVRILVKEKDRINIGDPLMILEAMKMESEITSDFSGIVKKINVSENDTVQEGDVLMEIRD